MLDERVENLITKLRNKGFEKFEYRFPWNRTESDGEMCLSWGFYGLFNVNTKRIDIYKSNLTSDYLCDCEIYDPKLSLEEIKEKVKEKFTGDRRPILFNSETTELTSISKGKDSVYINIKYYADDYTRATTLYNFVQTNLDKIKDKIDINKIRNPKHIL